jgi:hypothetical protein
MNGYNMFFSTDIMYQAIEYLANEPDMYKANQLTSYNSLYCSVIQVVKLRDPDTLEQELEVILGEILNYSSSVKDKRVITIKKNQCVFTKGEHTEYCIMKSQRVTVRKLDELEFSTEEKKILKMIMLFVSNYKF